MFDSYLYEKFNQDDNKKSEEEIKKLTLEDGMGELKRTLHILKKGEYQQKEAIIRNLPNIIQKDPSIEEKVLALIVSDINKYEVALQVDVGQSFLEMIQKQTTKNFRINEFLLDLSEVALSMLKSKNNEVRNKWVEVLSEILLYIPFQSISKKVFDEINDRGNAASSQMDQFLAMKLLSGTLKVCEKEISTKIPLQILDKAKLFSQFEFKDVKLIVVEEIFEPVIRGYAENELGDSWKDLLLELIFDKNYETKIASIKIMPNVLEFYHLHKQRTLLKDFVLPSINSQDPKVLQIISKNLGKIVVKLKQVIEEKQEHLTEVLASIEDFSAHKTPFVRENLFYNLPALIFVYEDQVWDTVGKNYINCMLKDENLQVRLQCVASLSEVMNQLGVETSQSSFKSSLKALIQEENKTIKEKFYPQLQQILQFLFIPNNSPAKKNCILKDLLTTIITLLENTTKSSHWRLNHQLLEILHSTQGIFSLNVMNDIYVPCLLKIMEESCVEMQIQACVSLVSFITINIHTEKRENIFNTMSNKFLSAKTYKLRLVYLHFVQQCLKRFSKTFFRNSKLYIALQLHNDKVPNVRIILAELLVQLKCALMEDDKQNAKKFNDILEILKKDKDREVQNVVQQQLEILDNPAKFQEAEKDFIKEQNEYRWEEYLMQKQEESSGFDESSESYDFLNHLLDKRKLGSRASNAGKVVKSGFLPVKNMSQNQQQQQQQQRVITPQGMLQSQKNTKGIVLQQVPNNNKLLPPKVGDKIMPRGSMDDQTGKNIILMPSGQRRSSSMGRNKSLDRLEKPSLDKIDKQQIKKMNNVPPVPQKKAVVPSNMQKSQKTGKK